MSESMSQEFVTAFITECFARGISKEAAAELLQKESVDQVTNASPGFAEGYHKVASQFPGQLRPIVFMDASLEKEAGSRGKAVMEGIKLIGQGGKKAIGGGLAAGGGVLRAGGNAITRSPRAAFGVGAVGAGGGAVAASAGVNKLRQGDPLSGLEDPSFSPGGYDPTKTKDLFNEQMGQYKPGIFRRNKELDVARARLDELDEGISTNEPGAGAGAMHERNQLRKRLAGMESDRSARVQGLSEQENRSKEIIDRISQRQAGLEDAKTSWLSAPKRLWLKSTGRTPEDYYNNRIAELQGKASGATLSGRTAAERLRLINGKVTSQRQLGGIPSKQDMQDRFFQKFER